MFVAFVKVKSLLKVNTRKALRSSLTCTFILENEKSFSWVLPKYSTSCGEIHFERASKNNKSFWWIKFSFELYARCFVMQGYVNWLLLCNLEEFIAYKNDKTIVSQYFQYLATSAPCLRLLLRQRLEARRNVSSELMRSYLLWFRHHSSENQNYSTLPLGWYICLAFCYHTLHWSVWTMAGVTIWVGPLRCNRISLPPAPSCHLVARSWLPLLPPPGATWPSLQEPCVGQQERGW